MKTKLPDLNISTNTICHPNSTFGSSKRLSLSEEFKDIMTSGHICSGVSFDAHFRNSSTPKLGLIIPKRLAKNSTLRNAIKRQGREAFRLNQESILSKEIILRLKRPIKTFANDIATIKSLRDEIESLFIELAQLNPPIAKHYAN